MKKKLFFGVGFATLMLASCGGAEETTEEEVVDVDSTEVVVVEAVTYEIDTATSIINWANYHGEDEVDHSGTVKVLSGSFTTENDLITSASLKADMNTITSDSDKLTGHLADSDFFDVNQYASAEFTLNGHEEGLITGKLNAAGIEFDVEAEATVTEGTVEISDFRIDMSALPFFVTEKEKEADESKWHNANIGFSASILGK